MKFPTVKVCGNTDPEIIKLCVELGASLIGFVINYPKSPRSISINKLKKLTFNIPKNIKKVAVMVNPTINEVKEVSNYCNTIQLHGDEDNKFINIIKKLKEIGHTRKIEQLIIHQAKLAKKAGCYAVICSGKESLKINKLVKIKTITPGIRLPGENANDQKRITSPKDALVKQKAYGIVIGRSISLGNIVNNFKKLFQNLES